MEQLVFQLQQLQDGDEQVRVQLLESAAELRHSWPLLLHGMLSDKRAQLALREEKGA